MTFQIDYHPKFYKDMKKLGLSKKQKLKVLDKVEAISDNPYSKTQGGLGEPLSGNLKGLMKFRFDQDYRVVYRLLETDDVMRVLVIGLRKDKEVYKEAERRE